MSDEEETFLDWARAIGAGETVDWDSLAATGPGSGAHAVFVARLRDVARIVAAHADLPRQSTALQDGLPVRAGAAPRRFAGLDLLGPLGSGSFGDVYRARDRDLERDVALKLLRLPAHTGDEPARRILEEARLLARVRHPNVVVVHGAAREGDTLGFWMELIDGRTLREETRERGTLGADEAGPIGIALCGALAAVHRAGLVHGDVKPANIVRERGGRIVLMDFGAARVVQLAGRGPVSGTPLYSAPEVLGGAAPSAESDVYSLGVMLYQLVSDSFPVVGSSFDELRAAHAAGARIPLHAVRPDLPAPFVRVVERAIAADPGARFRSAAEMGDALARALGFAADAASAPPAEKGGVRAGDERSARRSKDGGSRRRASLRVAFAATAVALLAIAAVTVAVRRDEAPAPGSFMIEARFVRAEADGGGTRPLRDGDVVRVGDAVGLDVRVSPETFVYVLNEDDAGALVPLFPLDGSRLRNPLRAGPRHRLPGIDAAGARIYWEITTPAGRERLLVVASATRLTDLEHELEELARVARNAGARREPLQDNVRVRLRSLTGITRRPGTPDRMSARLFDDATPLAEGEERVRGTFLRRIDLRHER